jgi:fatty acid desaturase
MNNYCKITLILGGVASALLAIKGCIISAYWLIAFTLGAANALMGLTEKQHD